MSNPIVHPTIPDSILTNVRTDAQLTYVPPRAGLHGGQLTTQFLVFTHERDSASGLTQVWSLHSKNRIALGDVSFNAGWRKYTFSPAPNTMFDSKCLLDIQVVLDILNSVHKQRLAERKQHANTQDCQAEASPATQP